MPSNVSASLFFVSEVAISFYGVVRWAALFRTIAKLKLARSVECSNKPGLARANFLRLFANRPVVPVLGGSDVAGAALADQVRSMGWRARKAVRKGRVSERIVREVLGRAAALLA